VLDLDLEVEAATAGVRLDQQRVGIQSGSRRGMGRGQATQGDGCGAVACIAETLRHRVGGHGVSLDEGDGGRRKERLREWQSGERGDGLLYTLQSGRYLPRHTETVIPKWCGNWAWQCGN
jgi:hypothetical protein